MGPGLKSEQSDNDNDEVQEEVGDSSKWSCLKMLVVSVLAILLVYGMLAYIISRETRNSGK